MSDTPTQAMPGADAHKGENTGIDAPGGKQTAGESGGGGYPNPQASKKGDESGFMGHGGQSHIDYSGTGAKGDVDAGNNNAATGAKVGE